MKHRILQLCALALGFSISTAIAFVNGYQPCDIYGYCEIDILAENEKLLNEARQLKAKIDELNNDKAEIVNDLQKYVAEQNGFNALMKSSIVSIAEIIKRGETNEEKIRNIAEAINDIGDRLINQSPVTPASGSGPVN